MRARAVRAAILSFTLDGGCSGGNCSFQILSLDVGVWGERCGAAGL